MPDVITTESHTPTSLADVGNFVADCRFALKIFSRQSEQLHDLIDHMQEGLDRLKSEKSPFNKHRELSLEAKIQSLKDLKRSTNKKKIHVGELFMQSADWIDENTSFAERLMLFNVNPADAGALPDDAGTADIVYIHRLSDSAMNRGKDFSDDVLTNACIYYFCDQIAKNSELQKAADKFFFGKGGMFEFLPTYRMENGEMVRNPPKLRVADDCDLAVNK